MPIDCEYVLSVSPPIFTARSFKSYSACDPFGAFGQPFPNNGKSRLYYSDLNLFKNGRNKLNSLFPLRSCLNGRSNDLNGLNKESNKKKVVFADDKGFSLTTVKFLVEPTDCPPLWDDSFLERVTRGVKPEVSPCTVSWKPQFVQPAADYLRFRNKLESNCVSLENVIVKDDESLGEQVLNGTVKVKNLEFHKEVFLRISFDSWKSHKDVACDFVPGSADPDILPAFKRRHDLYDTFSFNVRLPDFHEVPVPEAIEFCVHFVSGKSSSAVMQDYWDNNNEKNYRLIPSQTQSQTFSSDERIKTQFEDALTAELSSWTDFASWQHLINDSPYW